MHGVTPRRVVVVGSSGSGKSTLARALADRLGVAHAEIDALHWGPNWTPADAEVLRERIAAATAGDGWVVDGNYRSAVGDLWRRVDTIVWLDYPLWLILWRLLRRTWRRHSRRELLWGGCREQWTRLFSTDSIFWWALKTYARRRREFPALLRAEEQGGRVVLRFRRPRQTRRWFEGVGASNG
jgi:adenylate kinase family enzyme